MCDIPMKEINLLGIIRLGWYQVITKGYLEIMKKGFSVLSKIQTLLFLLKSCQDLYRGDVL